MARPNPNAPLGQGGRFAAVEAAAARSGARNPGGVAYAAGVKKYGKKKMTQLAQAGRRRGDPPGTTSKGTRKSRMRMKKGQVNMGSPTTAFMGGDRFKTMMEE
jgi:hypothetical protein